MPIEGNEPSTRSSPFRLFMAVMGAIGIEFIAGLIEAQSAVLLPQLEAENSTIPITQDQASWIASLGTLACPFTSFFCGPIMDLWGRKQVFKIYYFASTLGFLIISFAKEVYHLYIGRFCLAFALGFTVANVIYLPEICTTKQRSKVLSTIVPFFSFGLLVYYTAGGYLYWKVASMIMTVISGIGFIGAVFLPESPAWLVKKKKFTKARRTFQMLGRNNAKIEKDIDRLKFTGDGLMVKSTISLNLLFHQTVWKPFLILVAFHALQTLTGVYNIMFYTVEFFKELGTTSDPLLITIGLAAAKLVITCSIGLYFTTNCKRKSATAMSGFGSSIGYVIAFAYEWKYSGIAITERSHTWIPVAAILFSCLMSTAGVQSLPWIMTGEMYPLSLRGVMGGATFFVGNACLFLTIKFHFTLINFFGIKGVILFFGFFSILSGLFGIFVLPETQGKTMAEIEKGFTNETVMVTTQTDSAQKEQHEKSQVPQES